MLGKELIMSEKEDLIEEVEIDLSQLFVGVTCKERSSEVSEFLSIFERTVQNWTAGYLHS